jgi:hypothetical protein
MRCEEFRAAITGGKETPEVLVHLRSCDDCMNFAGEIDGEYLFRALGGEEMVPPGGVDQFVEEVMHQVRMDERQKELRTFRRPAMAYGWSLAAAAALTVLSVSLAHRAQQMPADLFEHHPSPIVASQPAPLPLINVPVIEEYENSSAMIVEMPEQETNGMKVVMIIDDSLPVDL